MAYKKHPGGKPPKYKTAAQMQEKIDAYFTACEGEPLTGPDGVQMFDKYGNELRVGCHPPTITGLALALGFASRQSLLDYQAKREFLDTITRAKARCEQYAEERLFDREKQKYHKLKHITDMAHAAEFRGQTAHVVVNYRGKVNRTFAISASAVLEYMNTQTHKSIPWQWAALNGIEVEQRLLRVHWRYDVEGLLRVLEGGDGT